jgi:hypothetical protein
MTLILVGQPVEGRGSMKGGRLAVFIAALAMLYKASKVGPPSCASRTADTGMLAHSRMIETWQCACYHPRTVCFTTWVVPSGLKSKSKSKSKSLPVMIDSSIVTKSFYYTATERWHAPMPCFCPEQVGRAQAGSDPLRSHTQDVD